MCRRTRIVFGSVRTKTETPSFSIPFYTDLQDGRGGSYPIFVKNVTIFKSIWRVLIGVDYFISIRNQILVNQIFVCLCQWRKVGQSDAYQSYKIKQILFSTSKIHWKSKFILLYSFSDLGTLKKNLGLLFGDYLILYDYYLFCYLFG